VKAPHSLDAERSVLGQMLRDGEKVCSRVMGSMLEPRHFYAPAHKVIYQAMYDNYYADLPIDPLSIADMMSKKLATLWSCDESVAAERIQELATSGFHGNVLDHAAIVKQKSGYREILDLLHSGEGEIERETKTPEEVAGILSEHAMRIATDSLLTQEILPFHLMGQRAYEQMLKAKVAHEKGNATGAKFGLPFIDDYTRGLRGTELWLCAGEPGVGKSAVLVNAVINYAQQQMRRPEDKRIGALVLSLEMGEEPTNMRIVSALTGLDGGRLREGRITDGDMGRMVKDWGRRKEIPLYFNYASNARASQLRALVVEGIRKYNTGLVIIDHFRHFRMDRHYDNQLREDEEKVKFLKESIAGDLGTAVVCICHTTKGISESRNSRPNLTHLRGSYQVAAAADFVSFIHQPYMYADDMARETGEVTEDQMENIWEKNRHGYKGIAPFTMNASRMEVKGA
jgi:replicative DNA helicase